MIEYENELDNILQHSGENKPKNYISILHEKVKSINSSNEIQNSVLNRFVNKLKWISGLSIFSGMFSIFYKIQMSRNEEMNALLSAIISGGGALLLTPFVLLALLGIVYFIISTYGDGIFEQISRDCSKIYKEAAEQGESNEVELYKLLQDPFVQHEIITYLQKLQSLGYDQYVKSDLENVIEFLSKKDYLGTRDLVIKRLATWLNFEQLFIKRNTEDTTKENFLKELNSYVNNQSLLKEESKNINYDLKSML